MIHVITITFYLAHDKGSNFYLYFHRENNYLPK